MESPSSPWDNWGVSSGSSDSDFSLQDFADDTPQQHQQQQVTRERQQQYPGQPTKDISLPANDVFMGDTISPSQLSFDFLPTPSSHHILLDTETPESMFMQSSSLSLKAAPQDAWSPLIKNQLPQDHYADSSSSGDLTTEPSLSAPAPASALPLAGTVDVPSDSAIFDQDFLDMGFMNGDFSQLGDFQAFTTGVSSSAPAPAPAPAPLPSLDFTPGQQFAIPDLPTTSPTSSASSTSFPQTALATLTTSEPIAPSQPSPQPYKVTKPQSPPCSPASPRREIDASSSAYPSEESSMGAGPGCMTPPNEESDGSIAIPRVSRRARKEPLPEIQFDPDDPVAAKRARNTLAARKSRARRQKQEEWSTKRIRELERTIKELEGQVAFWKAKAGEGGAAATATAA